MTFEEMQQIIEGMLSVQRELQNSQLRFDSSLDRLGQEIAELKQSTEQLNEISTRHERRIEQMIGYSITGESDRLDILTRLSNVENRVTKLEGQ